MPALADSYAVVLAAGKGTRMKSDLAKVLHPVAEKPLLAYVLETLRSVGVGRTVVVVGHQAERVEALCRDYDVETVHQEPQLGTGHAVEQAAPLLTGLPGWTLVLSGDVPLLQSNTLEQLMEVTADRHAAATVLTAAAKDPTGYGRILRDDDDHVVGIVEHKDATESQREILEYNTGTYCFDNEKLWPVLSQLDQDNSQGEFYLTDVIALFVAGGQHVEGMICADEREVQGINTVEELDRAERDRTAMLQEGTRG